MDNNISKNQLINATQNFSLNLLNDFENLSLYSKQSLLTVRILIMNNNIDRKLK